ncbi:MAG: 7-cyano-7-deazaguanine synthase QueC [Candidatus Cloacimonadota bacterium]|nr:MAG: 7-cyano-7-deazaguanine synthase QueC [Candidatus Cloacimonadota bacterium]
MVESSALVVFSGGQDSTTCLYWALKNFSKVIAISFDYGQKHKIELESAKKITKLANVEHEILEFDLFSKLGGNSLTDDIDIEDAKDKKGLPNSFVPGRNILFLSYVACIAYSKKIKNIVTGVCETDFSGYPDCRDDTIKSLQVTLNLAMETKFVIHTPLMWLSKAKSIDLALEVGAMDALAYSHTCYNGVYPPCMKCPACILREKGFKEANQVDPIFSRN